MYVRETGELVQLTKQHAKKCRSKGMKGIVYEVGEKVEIKGGLFKIKSIGRRMMVVEGVPGTRLNQGEED